MILAAGLGTRLRPLTHEKPKALVEINGTPLLGIVARRMISAGVTRLVINVHHFPDKIRAYIDSEDGFGVDVQISHEVETPLETGGALLHARALLPENESFLVHNVDIIGNVNLGDLYLAHRSDALATLLVDESVTPRYLLVDEQGRFCGYGNREAGNEFVARPAATLNAVDFCGVQVVSPALLDRMNEAGIFSIMDVYFRLARADEPVYTWQSPGRHRWVDVGTHERLEQARMLLEEPAPM
jgi:NDP-sugar pyrophosphorylase family protein